MTATLVGAAPAAAAETAVDGITYEHVDESNPALGAAAIGYDAAQNPTHPHVSVAPAVTLDGIDVPVVAVGPDAFRASAIESASVPSSVREIDAFAFAYNDALTDVDLEDGVEAIRSHAFRNSALSSVELPDSLTALGHQAFFSNQLSSVAIPNGITEIGISTFARNALVEVTIPSHVTAIRERAFAENSLERVVIAAGLDEVGWNAFDLNPALESIRFLGLPPTLGNVGTTSDPSGNPIATDPATAPRIEFLWENGDDQIADGFPWPSWNGFATVPVVDVQFSSATSEVETREVLLDQVSEGPWGTLTDDEVPVFTRPGHAHTGWWNAATYEPWEPGDPIVEPTTLIASWIDLDRPRSIELAASPAAPTVGERVTITATAINAAGDVLGDVTDDQSFEVSPAASVEIDGNEFVFSSAGSYTVTSIDWSTEIAAEITIVVADALDESPALGDETPAPADEVPAPTEADGEAPAVPLAPTGGDPTSIALAIGVASALAGLTTLSGARRRIRAKES